MSNKLVQIFFLICVVTDVCYGIHSTHNANISTRIAGGHTVELGEMPSQVSLQFRGHHLCGGTIIDSQHILTAAHCLLSTTNVILNPDLLRVTAGAVNLTSEDAHHFRVTHIYFHDEFVRRTSNNNIAILRVAPSIIFSPSMQPATLQQNSLPNGIRCTISGWGLRMENDYYLVINDLHWVEIYITDQDQCISAYPNVRSTMICGGHHDGGKGFCQGDLGGGLMCDNELSGIASFGYGCGRVFWVGVYTEVRSYREWIAETIERKDEGNLMDTSGSTIVKSCILLTIITLLINY